jgi:uncharacterized protein
MGSAIFELVILSLPSAFYARRLHRRGLSTRASLQAVGIAPGDRGSYLLALVLVVPVTALAAILLNVIPAHVLHGGSKNIVGAPKAAGDYIAVILLALAEEMLFRGFIATVLFKRFGFRTGNMLQTLIFLAPHLLLLLVSLSLWPILPLQAIAGWLLGWLRQRSGSIAPGWLLHALINLLPAVLFGL